MYVSNRVQPWPSKYPRSLSGSRVAKRLSAPMVTCDLKQILMAVKANLVVAHFSRIREIRKPSLTGEIDCLVPVKNAICSPSVAEYRFRAGAPPGKRRFNPCQTTTS